MNVGQIIGILIALLIAIFRNPLAKVGDSLVADKRVQGKLFKGLFYFGKYILPIIGISLAFIFQPVGKLFIAELFFYAGTFFYSLILDSCADTMKRTIGIVATSLQEIEKIRSLANKMD